MREIPDGHPAPSDANDVHVICGGARLIGESADALVVIDVDEHRRRQASGLGAVTDLALLDSLTGLPHQLPVAEAALGPRDRRRLVWAPAGAVDRDDAGLVRRMVPAADVRLVIVGAGPWAAFAKFAPATITLTREPDAEQLLQASFYGIGISSAGSLQGQVFLEPVAPAPSFSPSRWLFREQAYRAWLTTGSDHSVMRAASRRPATRAAG
jgi:hypothetical protein